jgi:hypothetical protein
MMQPSSSSRDRRARDHAAAAPKEEIIVNRIPGFIVPVIGSFSVLLGLSSKSCGTFLGFQVIDITENNDGLAEYAIYAQFDSPTDHLHNVFGADGNAITCSTGFFHNTIGGTMASALPYTSEQLAMSDNPDADSFVTIDYDAGDNNNTVLDPNFDEESFLTGNNLGTNAGWFDLEGIVTEQGVAGPDGLVLIAVFAPLNDGNGQPGVVSGTLTVGYDVPGPDPAFGTASFVTPAPGSLALLGIAAMFRARRRR